MDSQSSAKHSEPAEAAMKLAGVIGHSEVMQELFRMVRRVASSRATVLVSRGKRYGQGNGRRGHSRAQRYPGEGVCHCGLRQYSGHFDGIRVVRA